MKAKKLIKAMGGPQAVANLLNEEGFKIHSRQMIWHWVKVDLIPEWAELRYAHVWRKAENRMYQK
jgi:hypothetical protein